VDPLRSLQMERKQELVIRAFVDPTLRKKKRRIHGRPGQVGHPEVRGAKHQPPALNLLR
jgi:hypothetical protein